MAAQRAPVRWSDDDIADLGAGRADGGVPVPLTSFLGRETVLERVRRLLDDPSVRLLTLTGPGGVGKTRLAIEVAHQVREDFLDGTRYVPLAPVTDPALLLPTLARALGVVAFSSETLWDAMVAYLQGRHLLLLLDNLEHLLDVPPSWIGELITGCPRLTILATSQVALHIGGEQRFEVPPLTMDAGADDDAALSEAVQLFEQRARAMKPDFAVTPSNREAVERICRKVDGLPLAIELAASRILFLDPHEIATHLSNRLRILTGGQRDLPNRLQSMRNAIAWSHELLHDEERRLFRRLAVFVGGFTLEAAEAVCGDTGMDVLAGIASLLDRSLIRRVDAETTPRFVMLEVIREFGLEQLDAAAETEEIRNRHANWCLAVSRRVAPDFQKTAQPELDEIAIVEDDYSNMRAALEWLDRSARHDALAAMVMHLRSFWYLTERYDEALRWLEHILAMQAEPSIELLRTAGQMAQLIGSPRADEYLLGALERARTDADTYQEAEALFHLGILNEDSGDYDLAADRFAAALQIYEDIANPLGIRQSIYHLGVVDYGRGKLDAAKQAFEQVITMAEKAGDPLLPIWSGNYLVLIACDKDDIPRAAALLQRQAEVLAEPGLRHHVPDFLATAGVLAVAQGRMERAALLFGASGRTAYSLMLPERAIFEAAVGTARDAFGEAAFERARDKGKRLDDAAVAREVQAVLVPPDGSEAKRAPEADTAPEDDFGLSPRELDVLRLLADGLTNQEIADALYVSPRTVASHIDHILTKLDVRSRTAAVAHAIRNGMA